MRRVLLATALAVLGTAAPASAMTLVTAQRVDALALRGDGVLIASGARPAPQVRLIRGADRPTLVATGGAGSCATDDVELAASDAVLAVDLLCGGRDVVLGGLTGHALAPIATGPRPGGVAVTALGIAYVDRSAGSARILFRDPTTDQDGGLLALDPDINSSTVRLRGAGQQIASVAGIPGATVQLQATDFTGQRPTASYASDIADFDAAADGTVALLRRDRGVPCGARLLVAGPGQIAPVGVVDCARPLGVRLAAGKIAYVGRDGIELFDLASGAITPRQRIPRSIEAGGRTTLAFDGTRLAYTVPSCGPGRDVILDVVSGAAPSGLSATCPIFLDKQFPKLRKGRAVFSVRCPQGCHGLRLSVRQGKVTRHSTTPTVTGLHPGAAIVTASTLDRDDTRSSRTVGLSLR